jgi:beta-galactosidase
MKKIKEPYLVSGEIHYFRVPREDWGKRLDLLIESGATCAATYIPWMIHEPEEGSFVFSKNAETDLNGFLTLCKEKGVDVIARPGPYQYSELRWCGLPPWLCENHPEIMARNQNGEAYNNFAVSYLHPLFLEKTKNWFDAVLPILEKHDNSRGGAIKYVQIDNEMGFHEWFGGWDYHPDVMGWGKDTGPWAEFKQQNPAGEYHSFYFSKIAEYACVLAKWIRDAGIKCTLMHNAANPNMVSYFRDTAQVLGNNFLLGVDMYFNLGMDFEANNPTPIFAANGFLGFEQLRLMGFTPSVLEMQAGNCAEWPPTTPQNLKCWYNTCLAMGMKGVNWYVFTGGPNPPKVGGDGDLYDYCAPVGPFGEIRPAYDVIKDFSSFVNEESWLIDAEMEHNYMLGMDWAHPRGKNDKIPGVFGNPEAWNLLRKGVLITGFCASHTPKVVDLSTNNWLTDTHLPLVIGASQKMPRAIQNNIVTFIKNGGKILVAPFIPTLDENGESCTILKDFVNAGAFEELKRSVDFCFDELTNISITAAFCCETPQGGHTLGFDKFSGKTTAWEKSFENGGKVLWLGMSWKHCKHIHTEMLNKIMMKLSAPEPAVHSSNPFVWTVSRSYKNKSCIFAMNLFASSMEATITPLKKAPFHLRLNPMETKIILR